MVITLIETLKILGLAIVILLAAGMCLIIFACIIFILKELAKVWKNGKSR